MKFKNPLLAVSDMAASIGFYKRVLGLRIVMDSEGSASRRLRRLPQRSRSWFRRFGRLGKCRSVGLSGQQHPLILKDIMATPGQLP